MPDVMRATALVNRPAADAARVRGRVRAVAPADLPAIADLFLSVFGAPPAGVADARAYLETLLFDHPWLEPDLPSLVYEAPDGTPSGLLGVMPRRLIRRGQQARLAIGHHLMVAPESRGHMACFELMRAFMAGPQDAAILEACTPWRRLWEVLGGTVAVMTGLRWTRMTGPIRYVLGEAMSRGLPSVAGRVLRPAADAADAIARRLLAPLRVEVSSSLSAHPFDADEIVNAGAVTARTTWQAVFDRESTAWLLRHLRSKVHRGQLQGAMLRQPDGTLAGWFLYYLKPHGVSQVVALQGGTRIDDVFEHLAFHARAHGAGIITGQVDHDLLGCLGKGRAVISQPDDSWQLVHSRRQDLLAAVHSGEAALTRLETDWWLTY